MAARPEKRADISILTGAFFAPASVAVVGVGREPTNVGHVVFANLVGYRGRVYPINPRSTEILGHSCYADLISLPEVPELTIVAVPARAVPGVMEQLGARGGRAAIIISAGFKETGIDGSRLEHEIESIALRYGIRFLGPNCLGVMDTYSGLNASFAGELPQRGGIGFMSQSGALCTAILDWSRGEGVGFSKFVSLGNKADVDEIDLLRILGHDDDTKVIAIYMEGIGRGADFMAAAREAAARKPVIAIKAGATNAGARAVSSHTGTLAGSEAVYRAAFRQAAIVQAESVEELFDFAVYFSSQPLPKGSRVAIVTNAGGPGIMATDACERSGLSLASLEPETVESLRQALPTAAGLYNPVDVLGDAPAKLYAKAMELVLADNGVDSLLVLLTPQGLTDIVGTARMVAEAAARSDKPVVAGFMGKRDIEPGIEILRRAGVPNYPFPERAVHALAAASSYSQPTGGQGVDLDIPVDRSEVERVFTQAKRDGHRNILNLEGAAVVSAYGLRIPRAAIGSSLEDCLELARDIGYPVVLKVAAPDILHKSDVGAIKAGITDDEQLALAYEELGSNVRRYMPEALILGTVIQQMVLGGREAIIGVNRDPQFGPVVMYGLGGIYVEVLRDVAFRVGSIGEAEALAMIRETKSYPLLLGARGQAKADIDAMVRAIVRLSRLAVDFPEIVEVEVNPLMVLGEGDGCQAVDVRIVLG